MHGVAMERGSASNGVDDVGKDVVLCLLLDAQRLLLELEAGGDFDAMMKHDAMVYWYNTIQNELVDHNIITDPTLNYFGVYTLHHHNFYLVVEIL